MQQRVSAKVGRRPQTRRGEACWSGVKRLSRAGTAEAGADYIPARNAVTTFRVVSSTTSAFFVIPYLKGVFRIPSDFIMHASSRCRGSALYRPPPRTIAWAIFPGLSVVVHGDRYLLSLSCLRLTALTALVFTPPAVRTCVYIRGLFATPLYIPLVLRYCTFCRE